MAVPFTMSVYELIRRKRDRGRLTAPEIESLVSGYTRGDVPDYQMAAMLMAIFLRGMTSEETSALTMAMMNSGDVFDLSGIAGAKVDKHSTGGVGDKVSIILASLVAACGVKVPMVSGRALGHTGGTLDKLESIPGFRTNLTFAQFKKTVSSVGVAMMGQTRTMCPADRKLYALRDVTATVDSIPLIAASIMSKKLAEGVDGLVLDVKTGGGAFMSRPEQARHLARTMIGIGTELGRKVIAVVTDMSEPLGSTVGNALEVAESIEALHGKWEPDLEEVTLALGEEMLVMAGRATGAQQARRLLLRALNDGTAFEKFRQMVRAQGGEVRAIEDTSLLPKAEHSQKVTARAAGFVKAIDCLQVGLLGVQLGVGRSTLDSKIEPGSGFRFHKKTGAKVAAGELLAEVFASDAARAREAAARLGTLITIGATPPRARKLIETRLTRP